MIIRKDFKLLEKIKNIQIHMKIFFLFVEVFFIIPYTLCDKFEITLSCGEKSAFDSTKWEYFLSFTSPFTSML